MYNRTEKEKQMRKYTIEEIVKGRRWYVEFKDRNQLGEKILVEFSYCENSGSVHSLPNMWYKSGRIDRVLKNYWSISTFATDENGTYRGRYSPQDKLSEDGKRLVIDFDWMFEATEENAAKLLKEIEKRAFA